MKGGRWFAVVGIALLLGASAPLAFSGGPLPGGVIVNLDPRLDEPSNGPIWDPNYIPGFNASLPVSIRWAAPEGGPATIDYLVGPVSSPPPASLAPHFAVGPQVFSFVEVPRTQAFRDPSWGDYQAVQSGYVPCAITVGNSTLTPAEEVQPQYVGIPESAGDWGIELAIDWFPPTQLSGLPASGFVALVATTALPPLFTGGPARLITTQLELWSGTTSGLSLAPGTSVEGNAAGFDGETFPVDQLPNTTISRSYALDLSAYLTRTFSELGLSQDGGLLTYTYLVVGGYNTRIQLAIHNLSLVGPGSICSSPAVAPGVLLLVVATPLGTWLAVSIGSTRQEPH